MDGLRGPVPVGRPSTVMPLSSSSVASWFASISFGGAMRSSAPIACEMRSSSSHSLPSRRLILRNAARRSSTRTTSDVERRVTDGTSTSPSTTSQFIRLNWSRKGFSTSSYSGPLVTGQPLRVRCSHRQLLLAGRLQGVRLF